MSHNQFLYKYAKIALAGILLSSCSQQSRTFSVLQDSQTFKQDSVYTNPMVDILFVIDNSGSMESSQAALATNFQSFIKRFNDLGYDFQIGVTTTQAYKFLFSTSNNKVNSFSRLKDGNVYGPSPYTGASGYRIITPSTPNIENVFIKNVLQGTQGSGDERAFQSFKVALSEPVNASFHRAEAFLAVVIVSDEDDHSWNSSSEITNSTDSRLHTIASYVDFLKTFTNTTTNELNFNVSVVGIFDEACKTQLNREILTRYRDLADATKGVKASICGDFGTQLNFITEQIVKLTSIFKLDRIPLEDSIRIAVNGITIDKNEVNGWTYRSTDNAIVFHGTSIPPANSAINIDFDPVDLSQGQ